jgi:serine/threonine-protein kinase
MLEVAAISTVEGEIVAGKYRVLNLVGRGGMAEVFAAEHLNLHHTVAIKFLSPRAGLSPEIVARFLQEARAAVRLSSEHVTRVLDMGTLDSGLPYIVMEHLQGQDFQHLIETRGAFSISETVASVVQACAALAEAHAVGVVHRDLKPSNLFLTQRPDDRWFVKVLDFGIAKIHEEYGGQGITTTNDVFGTPAYMSPEQIRSAKLVDARTDIWSLGLILAECLTGKPVYHGLTKFGILTAIVADPVPNLHLDKAGAPPELEKVILRCLEKDPADRYQDVAELAHALLPFAGEESASVAKRIGRMVRDAGARAHESGVVTIDAEQMTARHRVPRSVAWVAAAGLFVAIAASVWQQSRSEASNYARSPSSSQPAFARRAVDPSVIESRVSAPAEPPGGASDRSRAEPEVWVENSSPTSMPAASGTPTTSRKASQKTAGVGAKARASGDARAVPAAAPKSRPSGLEDRK